MDSVVLAFSLGPAEVGMLLFIMLMLFGPKRIPELGKSLGEGLNSFKKATQEMNEEAEAVESKLKVEVSDS